MKKKRIVLIIILILLGLQWIVRYLWDDYACAYSQKRCIMYDLSEFDNEEDIAHYSKLNKDCASNDKICWITILIDNLFN